MKLIAGNIISSSISYCTCAWLTNFFYAYRALAGVLNLLNLLIRRLIDIPGINGVVAINCLILAPLLSFLFTGNCNNCYEGDSYSFHMHGLITIEVISIYISLLLAWKTMLFKTYSTRAGVLNLFKLVCRWLGIFPNINETTSAIAKPITILGFLFTGKSNKAYDGNSKGNVFHVDQNNKYINEKQIVV